ncbi:MAG: hypothetical protein RJA99_78 [Pseudomonadota bacterium]|jgi:hypothetical protein
MAGCSAMAKAVVRAGVPRAPVIERPAVATRMGSGPSPRVATEALRACEAFGGSAQ